MKWMYTIGSLQWLEILFKCFISFLFVIFPFFNRSLCQSKLVICNLSMIENLVVVHSRQRIYGSVLPEWLFPTNYSMFSSLAAIAYIAIFADGRSTIFNNYIQLFVNFIWICLLKLQLSLALLKSICNMNKLAMNNIHKEILPHIINLIRSPLLQGLYSAVVYNCCICAHMYHRSVLYFFVLISMLYLTHRLID